MVRPAVLQGGGWFGVGFFGPAAVEQRPLAMPRGPGSVTRVPVLGSLVLLPPAWGGLAGLPLPSLPRGEICGGRRAGSHLHTEKKCRQCARPKHTGIRKERCSPLPCLHSCSSSSRGELAQGLPQGPARSCPPSCQ